MAWKVAATFQNDAINVAPEGLAEIDANLLVRACRTEGEIISFARDADAIITQREGFTRRVIEQLDQCRIIAVVRTGYDNIDVAAATAQGICVTNGGSYCSEEVAIHTMALLLAVARKLVPVANAAKRGLWGAPAMQAEMRRIWKPMHRLDQQTLGIVGLGHIGRAVVPKARGFGLRIIAHDPYISSSVAEDLEVKMAPFRELLRQSDYVCVCASLTAETRHMFGTAEFRDMKPTAFIINTARGDILDQEALVVALGSGLIAGAALDAVVPEPLPLDHPLLNMENVIVTAHSAFYSETSMAELGTRAIKEAVRVLTGRQPESLVNPEVLGRFADKWGPLH